MASSRIVRPPRPAPVFVCRKCLKRSDDAKDIGKEIKRAMKRAAPARGKPARTIMTSCFGLCPKRAVVITAGVRAARGEYVLVSRAGEVAGALSLLHDDQNGSS
ncbi:hypothetical protein HL667_08860 [Bradyrhizobium sp. 83012]|uniref:(2Fe-2S) ferredoxin domain-containing protein n=1 Tax=Bradyrhizobium aeschynomenes TaxID=2734909 RepID=A0ABX2CA22_9BRAD|nr:hypothetical protein [Bradyrhizobium aeschynomenes]NPU13844.1 hypothetical protein [Bradyrhizobium aeschynomenes]NPU65102.1 hypothetical protein [Bradyrhizobium aeschynomenes]NPV24241.1 hypothetical protein [Bradyrhizobium aeschynomenes]